MDPELLTKITSDPLNATLAEHAAWALAIGASRFKMTFDDKDGEPVASIILLMPGSEVKPVLDILDAIEDEESRWMRRQKVMAALDELDRLDEQAEEEEAAHG